MIIDVLILIAIAGSASFLFSKQVRQSRSWRATVTPLASIIGSGFLVIAPLLAHIAGRYSLMAITVLVGLGYATGSVIRFNISHIEPLLVNQQQSLIHHIERLSKLALGFAYIISVSFYLQLLAVFLLKGLHIENIVYAHILTTLILLFIAIVGKLRGLNMLENFEEYSVSVKLSIIVGLLTALAYFNGKLFFSGQWHLQIAETNMTLSSFRTLFGSLIVIQGFETSRFLGNKYSAEERIETMRYSQIFSGIIYIVFIGLIAIVFDRNPIISDTAIIDLSRRVSSILPIILILAAAMSQFSAAIADTVGSGGLILESLKNKISLRNSYLLIGCLAIILTWLTNVFEIISLASRAFAFYYCLQAFEAALISFKENYFSRLIFFGLLSIFLLLITLFGTPASV